MLSWVGFPSSVPPFLGPSIAAWVNRDLAVLSFPSDAAQGLSEGLTDGQRGRGRQRNRSEGWEGGKKKGLLKGEGGWAKVRGSVVCE